MIREINIKVYYDCDDIDKYTDEITSPKDVEDTVYNEIIELFSYDKGFKGLRVDCNDSFLDLDDKRKKLKEFIGVN